MDVKEYFSDFDEFCKSSGYVNVKRLEDGRCVGIMPLLYTHAIIEFRDDITIMDRWCYHSLGDAVVAMLNWGAFDFVGEPDGWHRHPSSGRRRENGDPSKEIISP